MVRGDVRLHLREEFVVVLGVKDLAAYAADSLEPLGVIHGGMVGAP